MAHPQISQFPTQPAEDFIQLTADGSDITDANSKKFTARGFYVGATSGNAVVKTKDGQYRTIPVLANTYHYVYFTALSSSSTAAPIYALK